MSKIGQRLLDVRKELGFSQREVARAVGISQSTLSDIERGEITGRSLEILAGMARLFKVSADYLLDLKSEEVVYPTVAGLTPGESELIDLVRELSSERKRIVLRMARMLGEEETRRRRYEQLVSAIEAIDTTGMLERSQERLLVLAGELGSFRAAVTALAGEIVAARNDADEPLEEA